MAEKRYTVGSESKFWLEFWRDKDWENYSDKNLEADLMFLLLMRSLSKGALVLDAGCGWGRWPIYLNRHGYMCIGLDYDSRILQVAKQHFSENSFICGNIVSLPFSDNIFNLYLSLGVVEHIEKGPLKALQEANRVLKRGGKIICVVPYQNALRRFTGTLRTLLRVCRKLLRLYPRNLTFLEYRFADKEFMNWFIKAGFNHLSVTPFDFTSRDGCFGLVQDFPFLRGKGRFQLNKAGILVKSVLSSLFSPLVCTGFIAVCGEKH